MLTHVCFVTGTHRKAVVRKFRRLQMADPGRQEARGELLRPVVAEYVGILKRDGLWEHGDATPYQRILEYAEVAQADKAALRVEHGTLNPLLLKRKVDRKVKQLYDTQKKFGSHS